MISDYLDKKICGEWLTELKAKPFGIKIKNVLQQHL